MPLSPEQLKLTERMIACFNTNLVGDLTNVAASATALWYFQVPFNCTISKIVTGYAAETGTTPSLTVAVRSGSTALIQAAPDTANTPARATAAESGQSLTRKDKEILNIALTSANADNDFTYFYVQVWAYPTLTA